jgi:hypothetical protein
MIVDDYAIMRRIPRTVTGGNEFSGAHDGAGRRWRYHNRGSPS